MSDAETNVLAVFRRFRVGPYQMLCFNGPQAQRMRPAIQKLIAKRLAVREHFPNAYSLTPAGYAVTRTLGRAGGE